MIIIDRGVLFYHSEVVEGWRAVQNESNVLLNISKRNNIDKLCLVTFFQVKRCEMSHYPRLIVVMKKNLCSEESLVHVM